MLISYCLHALTLPCTYRCFSSIEVVVAEETGLEGEGQMNFGEIKDFDF